MAKSINILFLAFYFFGTFCLPMGDFSTIQDLPTMYRNCKTTEDKDITLIDFVTDHLLNIDGLFDAHNNGDEQKPHQSSQNQRHAQTVTLLNIQPYTMITKSFFLKTEKIPVCSDNFIPANYSCKIFHPPIAV